MTTVALSQNRLLPRNNELRTLVGSPSIFLRRYWLPLAVLALGSLLDAVTTYQNVAAYGAGIEVHPVQQLVMQLFGPGPGVFLAKLGQVSCVLLVAAWWRPWCGWILLLCGCFYALAAASNHFLWL